MEIFTESPQRRVRLHVPNISKCDQTTSVHIESDPGDSVICVLPKCADRHIFICLLGPDNYEILV